MDPIKSLRDEAAHSQRSGLARTSRTARLAVSVRSGANAICGCLFAAVFFVFCFKIISRYAGVDAAWADELTVILFIWILFLANGLVVPEKQQITFDLIHRSLSGTTKTVVEIMRLVLVLGIFVAAAPGALDYIHFLSRERTSVLNWRLDLVFACFGIFVVAMIVRMAHRFLVLIKPVTTTLFIR